MKKALKVVARVGNILFQIIAVFIIICLLGVIFVGVKIYPELEEAKAKSYDKLASIGDNTFKHLGDTVIYDKDGNKLGEINIGNYQYITIDNVSKWVQEGYIAVEDNNFKVHNGIDYKAVARAGIAYVKNRGKITQGGSTITQQVIKNNILTQEQTFERKFIELFLAPALEKQFNKNKIMEFYVNTNEYGNNCVGIETASQYYFNKPAKDLTIAESAMFVGMSNNPTKYNPVKRPEVVKEKRDFVLKRMYEEGVISEQEYKDALTTEITLTLKREQRVKESYQVSFAIHSATLKLMELEGFEFKYVFEDKLDYDTYKASYSERYTETAAKVRNGGYTIYTSLDSEKQEILQSAVDKTLKPFKEKMEDGRYAMQGAAVAVDNETGYVVAIVGGRGTEDEFNRGFLAVRQPGSSIKPIIVYGPAIDSGRYFPSSRIVDEPIKDGPENYGGGYKGTLPLREALAQSVNTVAFKIFMDLNPNTGLEYLEKMRFSTISYVDNDNGALALGGFTYGVRVFEIAKAYSTLVNAGTYSDNTCITKITHQKDGDLFKGEIKYTQVYEPDAAYMLLDCMKGVLTHGTGSGLQIPGLIAAGKTGTTNDKKDGWFSGVTPYYTVSVWCGYDTPRPVDNLFGATYPGRIWKEFMTAVHKDKEKLDFERPDTVVEKYVDWKGNISESNTGTKDLFSQVLIDKAESAKLDAQDALNAKEIQRQIDKLAAIKVTGVSSVAKVDKLERDIKKAIMRLMSDDRKKILLLNLKDTMSRKNEELTPYREELRKQEEEKERQKQQEIENNVISLLSELQDFEVVDASSAKQVTTKGKVARDLINSLTDLNKKQSYNDELTGYMERLNTALEPFKEPQSNQELIDNLEVKLQYLEGIQEEYAGIDELYNDIENLLSNCETKGIDTMEYWTRYSTIKSALKGE